MPYTPSFMKRENQYTLGGEYMTSRTYVVKDDPESKGKEYVGYFNITSEGPYTDKRFTVNSKPLFNIRYANTKSSQIYIDLSKGTGYVSDLEFDDPISTSVTPTDEDMTRGYFIRYFIQQRNDKFARIKEIDKKQFDQLADLSGGLNSTFYKSVALRWKISGPKNDILKNGIISKPGIEDTNLRTVNIKARTLIGLDTVLKVRLLDYSEFATGRDTKTDIKL